MLRTPFTFTSSAVLWSHPDGMLLKLTMLRSTAGVHWTGTESVKEAERKQISKLRHHPKSFSLFFFWSCFLELIYLFFPFLFQSVATTDKLLVPSVKVLAWTLLWIVESVAVDTDGREAALKPETKSEQAARRWGACVPLMKQMHPSQARQPWDYRHTFRKRTKKKNNKNLKS